MTQIARHIVFAGRVQGVGFRFTVHALANRYQLAGLVRNLMDGTVEMVAQGSPDDIEDCIRDIKGSYHGSIRETKTEEIPVDPSYQDFKITF